MTRACASSALLIEARIGLENRDEAKTFAAALQDFCGSQVRLSLEGQTIK
jgi:hypothetical protein